MNGRRELRSPQRFRVLLSNGEHPLVTKNASTENVSTNGARLQSDWPWQPGTRVLVQSSLGEFWGRARIVYCHTLPSNTFALGLQFFVRSGSLECRLFARLMLRWALLCCCPSICFALTSLQRPLAFSPVRPTFLRTSRTTLGFVTYPASSAWLWLVLGTHCTVVLVSRRPEG